MFYLNSLQEQISKTNTQLNLRKPKQKKYTDKTRNLKGKLIFITKFNVKYTDLYAHAQAHQNMSSIDFDDANNKSYTLKRLHNTWKEKYNVNFNRNHQKFLNDIMPPKVKEAKQDIKQLVDRDKFNTRLPRWNSTSKLINEHPISIKQSVFNITNGYTTWEGLDLKEPSIPEGVDSRNTATNWNNSTLMYNKEKDTLNHHTRHSAMHNTHTYWNKNVMARKAHSQLPISPDRRSVEKVRYYQEYKNPTKRTMTNTLIMAKVKEQLRFEREEIAKEVMKENPGCKHIKEKIDALVEKRMQSKYMKQFNIAIGKINEVQYNKKQKWKDDDLIEKINTITNWKYIDWFKKDVSLQKADETRLRKEILKPLVIKRKEITKEQDNIEISRINEYKKSLKKERIKKRNASAEGKSDDQLTMSKYPINQSFYEKIINRDYSQMPIKDSPIEQKDKDFFDAYKTIAINQRKEERKMKKKESKHNYSNVDNNNYYHPGKYRVFEYNKSILPSEEEDNEHFYIPKPKPNAHKEKEIISAWSCCLDDDPNSKGCRKEKGDQSMQ